jgi:hypothetical protein
MDDTYRVMPFGRDCLGNITGYRVLTRDGSGARIAGTFVDDSAKQRADELANTLNMFLRPMME